MKPYSDVEFAAFAGIDWADAKHDICLQVANSEEREFAVLAHRPAAIEAWAGALRQRFQGRPVAVCLELAEGPFVHALQKYDFLVLFPVHPATLAKYREAFAPSHAKADPSDAQLALELLLRYRAKLKPLTPQSVPMRMLLRLVEQRRRLVGDQNRISNRLTDALKQYFPDVLAWFLDKDTFLFCDFLSRWPTLKQLKNARRATLLSFFHEHHVRSQARIEERLRAIKAATALTDDLAVISPNQLLVLTLVEQLRVTLQAIERFDAEIATVSESLPDYALFRALPGAGATLAPRLLAAFGEQRERYQSASEIQRYTGIAPVTESSGKKHWVHWRLQCPTFLRQTFVEWAGATIPRSFWAAAYYRQQRAKVVRTRPRCARWPSSGFAFSIVAGKPALLTMRPPISTPSAVAARHYSLRSRRSQKILDRQSQGVSYAALHVEPVTQSREDLVAAVDWGPDLRDSSWGAVLRHSHEVVVLRRSVCGYGLRQESALRPKPHS